MPLPELIASVGIAAASKAISANQENAAAARANKMEAEAAKRQQARLDAEYILQKNQATSQYLWDVARTAQMRRVEAENEMASVNTGTRIIEAAANGLRINSQALQDKFVTEEALRAGEVSLQYGYGQDKLAADTMMQVSQFLTGINGKVAEGGAMLAQSDRSRSELLNTLTAEARRDQMEWQMAQLAGVVRGAQEGARAMEGQGGGVTAQRLAVDALGALGRQYEKVSLGIQDRDLKLGLANMMNDETAQRLAQQSIEIGDYVQRSRYALQRYGADSRLAQQQLEELTMPTFDLAQRQYKRELEGLQLRTKEDFDSAMVPYRRQEFFDPIAPIAGLPPTVQKPRSVGQVGTGAILAGIGLETGKAFLNNAIDKQTGAFKPDLGLSTT